MEPLLTSYQESAAAENQLQNGQNAGVVHCNYCLQKITQRYYYEPVRLFSELGDHDHISFKEAHSKSNLANLEGSCSSSSSICKSTKLSTADEMDVNITHNSNFGAGSEFKIAFHKCCLICCICKINLHQDYYRGIWRGL